MTDVFILFIFHEDKCNAYSRKKCLQNSQLCTHTKGKYSMNKGEHNQVPFGLFQ